MNRVLKTCLIGLAFYAVLLWVSVGLVKPRIESRLNEKLIDELDEIGDQVDDELDEFDEIDVDDEVDDDCNNKMVFDEYDEIDDIQLEGQEVIYDFIFENDEIEVVVQVVYLPDDDDDDIHIDDYDEICID